MPKRRAGAVFRGIHPFTNRKELEYRGAALPPPANDPHMPTLQEFYADKRVLVTGHTGFKGGWLCAWLKQAGARVTGLSLAPDTDPSLFAAAGIAEGMASVIGDIRDRAAVAAVYAEARPDTVFHLAAQPLVRRSYREPVETFDTNVMGTVHVLDAARNCPSVRAIVCVTTDKCYDNKEWVWGYRETDALGGKDPYSASKACAELVAAAYRTAMYAADGRIRMATARGGNVIGGGDWSEDRLVPDIVRAVTTGQPIVLRNPRATRPWQHVLELVRGYLVLGRRLHRDGGEAFAQAWNFGPGSAAERDVETLTRSFVGAWGAEARIEVVPSALAEANFLKLDIAKAVAQLGWQPILSFDETVRMTADWYRAHAADPASVPALVRAQLDDYFGRC